MTDAEKAAVKAFAHHLADEFLPQIIAAEEAKLPDSVKGIVLSVVGAIMPQLVAKADAYIDAKTA